MSNIGRSFVSMFALFFAVILFLLAMNTFAKESNAHIESEKYGGDAYTGIQNASAETANRVTTLNNTVAYAGGGLMLAASFSFFLTYLYVAFAGGKNNYQINMTVPDQHPSASDSANSEDAPQPVEQPEPPKPAEPEVDITPYLGKKWCGACGRLHEPNVAICSCGSRYLGVITRTNALNIIPNIKRD